MLADKYGAEALRYYLMSDIATGRDADFSEERLVQRYNTDLANTLGNLAQPDAEHGGEVSRTAWCVETEASIQNTPWRNSSDRNWADT